MKAVIVNGSLQADDLVARLVESTAMGLKAAGEPLELEVVTLLAEDIAFCTACRRCLERDGLPLGTCPLAEGDRMRDILLAMRDADRIVLATPLMLGTVTSLMKRFLERCAPLTYNSRRGRLSRVKRRRGKRGAIIVVHSFLPVLSRLSGKVREPVAMLKLILRAAGCEETKTLAIRVPRLPPYRTERVRGRAFALGLDLVRKRRRVQAAIRAIRNRLPLP